MTTLRGAWRDRRTHRRVWALAAPMVLSNLTIPLVALTDSAVVGHLPSAQPLGAVAVGSALYGALVGVLGFLRMGTTGFAAQAAGAREGDRLRSLLAQALLAGLAIALLAGLTAQALLGPALAVMDASPALDELSRVYVQTRLLGLPAGLASYVLIGWFLGVRRARAPLAMLLATNLGNVALDLWFVLGLDWGVAGAARASVIAEWAGLAVGLCLLPAALRRHPGRLLAHRLWCGADWRRLLGVNRDIFLRSLMLQAVFVLVAMQGARLGDTTVAANALLLNGLALTAYALDALAHALEALCGQAIGARDRPALQRALLVAGGWAVLGSLAFSAFFGLAGETYVGWLTDLPEVREQAARALPYLALLPPVAVWSYLLDGLFIAATRAREMRDAMARALAVALPLGVMAQTLGNHGLWLALLAFMALRGLFLGLAARRLWRAQAWA